MEKTIRILVAKPGLDGHDRGAKVVAQALANLRELGITERDYDRVNVNGSCVSIGHPLGVTGARILISLLNEMRRRQSRYGMIAICGGGGMGVSGIIERA